MAGLHASTLFIINSLLEHLNRFWQDTSMNIKSFASQICFYSGRVFKFQMLATVDYTGSIVNRMMPDGKTSSDAKCCCCFIRTQQKTVLDFRRAHSTEWEGLRSCHGVLLCPPWPGLGCLSSYLVSSLCVCMCVSAHVCLYTYTYVHVYQVLFYHMPLQSDLGCSDL